MKKASFLLISAFVFTSCSSLLKYVKSKDEFKNAEFEKKVVIVEATEPKLSPEKVEGGVQAAGATTSTKPKITDVKESKVKSTKKNSKNKNVKASVNLTRQPEIEDSEGFNNQRRPPIDPFRVGEVITHDVSYLGATAGTIKFRTNPFAIVNGKKSYNFVLDLKTTSFFSRVFAVDDTVQTYMDYETLVPYVFKLDIRDSGQVKEAQAYFDVENLKADYWEHRFTEKHGHEEKKISWTILPYSQNPFSAVFYMRVFNYEVGKDYTFRVADDEKNVSFKAHVLEKTTLSTDAGEFKAIKMKAEVYSRGNLAKASDFFIWISDDEHKYILRIEVKLPFGSVVSEVSEIIEGKP